MALENGPRLLKIRLARELTPLQGYEAQRPGKANESIHAGVDPGARAAALTDVWGALVEYH